MLDQLIADAQTTLPVLLRRRAGELPDTTAITAIGHPDVTWATLDAAADRWAAALHDLGVGPGDAVLTMMASSYECFYVWLGAARRRAIEVAVNTAYRGEWLRHVFDDSRARVAVVGAAHLERVLDIAPSLTHLETLVVYDAATVPEGLPFRVVGGPEFLAGASADAPIEAPAPWDPACIVYTSGTTGRSKGVVMPWGQYSAPFVAVLRASDPADLAGQLDGRFSYYSPFAPYHVTGKNPLVHAAIVGGRLVIREQFSTADYWDDIRVNGCTQTLMVGAMANFLHQQPAADNDADNPLELVTMVPVIPGVDDFKRRFGVEVQTCYNMTELSTPLLSTDVHGGNYRTCGQPRPGVEVRVVDEHDQVVPTGAVGELIVRADEPWTLNQGYLGRPEESFAAWRNGWFHTGDGFTVDDSGDFYFVDRLKDAIRRRGENISSFEVEGVVNQHPAVLESAAVAVPSPLSEDEVKVVVVAKPDAVVVPGELIEFLVPRMPRFAIPRYVEVVDALPKTPTERVRKGELRDAGVTAATWDREAAGIVLPR